MAMRDEPNAECQTKDAERRDKEERSSREGHEVSAGPVKTFRKPAMSKKHRWPMDEGNLRVKRRDPWHWANPSSKAMPTRR